MLQEKLSDYIGIIKTIRKKDILSLLLWYLRLKDTTKVRIGSYELRLGNNRREGLWYMKVLSRALRQGIDVSITDSEIKFCINDICFREELGYYGFLTLRHLILLLKNGVRFVDDYCILPNGLKFKYPRQDPIALGIIGEVFIENIYEFLDITGREVIDVGGYIGETAIYFMSKGAKIVYVYEPNQLLFSYILENIKLNGYETRIIPFNYAISYEDKFIELTIPEGRVLGSAYSDKSSLNKKASTIRVRAVRLPLEGDVLKMDCEGCEFETLLNMPVEKLQYVEIGLEYHAQPQPLIKRLERGGYKVKIVRRYSRDRGLLHAYKKR